MCELLVTSEVRNTGSLVFAVWLGSLLAMSGRKPPSLIINYIIFSHGC